MVRELKIDIQIDSLAFARFICAFGIIDGFCAMPWTERAEMLKAVYGINVTDRTLKSWGAKLIERGLLIKTGESVCWRTLSNTIGDKIRELVTGDSEAEEEAKAYFKERAKIVNENKDNKAAWGIAFKKLWDKYGCCYYYCKGLTLAAYSDEYTLEVFQ